jgi:O-antigen/teichoic acid export membrane protein
LGIYSISSFLYYLFAFLGSFELTTYFGKEIAHRRDRVSEIKRLYGEMVTTSLLGVGLSLPASVFMFIFYHQIDAWLLVISMVSGLIFGFEKNLAGALLGREKMHFEFISQAAAFVMVAVPVCFYVRELDIAGVYYLRIAASVVCIGVRGYFAGMVKYLEKKYVSLKSYNWKEIGFFSGSGFAIFIQQHIDLFILSFLISREVQGAYFLALRIFLAFTMLAEITAFALTPFISRIYRGKDTQGFAVFYARMFYLHVVLGAAAAAVLFFTRDLLAGAFAGKNSPVMTSEFLFYFSFLIFFRSVSYYTGNVLTSTRFQGIWAYIVISTAALMILLEFILGKLFSVYGVLCARGIVELLIFSGFLVAAAKAKNPSARGGVNRSFVGSRGGFSKEPLAPEAKKKKK